MKSIFHLIVLLLAMAPASAQTLANRKTWHYQLTHGAAIMEDCPICDRVSIWEPLIGRFDLVGTATANIYQITNLFFGSNRSALYPFTQIEGGGTLDFTTGEPDLTLDVTIKRSTATNSIHLTNALPELPRIFPIIGMQANESPGSPSRVFRLRIAAAPITDVWFSIATNAGGFSSGEILGGRFHMLNSVLTRLLSIPDEDVGLDAMDVGPRGEIFFSIATNTESVVNGPISHGDIVTSAGRVYLQSAQLLAPFGVEDPDAGLDALHIVSDDEVYFSISKDIPRTGAPTLGRGDILSSKGRIIRTESNLLVRWVSALAGPIGLDALYIWPNGEIWFSTENDFTATDGTVVHHGDVISDQGYVVYTNAELMNGFGGADPAIDYGLDALTIITDANASAAPTQFLEITPAGGEAQLRWDGAARVFQVERASSVEGPYTPITLLTVDRFAIDVFPATNSFYRIRQW